MILSYGWQVTDAKKLKSATAKAADFTDAAVQDATDKNADA